MIESSQVREGMVVYSSDGEKLGKVQTCGTESFEIEKGFFFPKDYVVRYDEVLDISDHDEVRIARTRQELEAGEVGGEPAARRGATLGAGEGEIGSPTGTSAAYGTTPEAMGTGSTLRAGSPADAAGIRSADEVRVPISEEQLEVEKRERDAGEVRLRKDVVTETQHVDVPVTREEVRVERTPVAERTAEAAGDAFQEKTVSMPVKEEEIEIRKRPVVKEEVRLRKDRVVEQRAADEEVRKERVDVEGDQGRAIREEEDKDVFRE